MWNKQFNTSFKLWQAVVVILGLLSLGWSAYLFGFVAGIAHVEDVYLKKYQELLEEKQPSPQVQKQGAKKKDRTWYEECTEMCQHDCATLNQFREETKEEKQPEPKPEPISYNPYEDKKFYKKFPSSVPVKKIREADYGIGTSRKILVRYHEGGEQIGRDKLTKTVRAVIQRMPNLRTTDNLVALAVETMITETGAGKEKVSTGIRLWNNYGIAQFRIDTAEETITWLKKVRPDVHDQVMSLFDEKHDLTWNLSYNVPFSIGMMLQYYWRMVPGLYQHIDTVEKRAEMWKAVYNSSKGKGTVQCYINRVNNHPDA